MLKIIKKYSLLFVGAVIASVGLEIFLIPNQVIDGGVVGISIMLGYITTTPLKDKSSLSIRKET